MLLQHGLLVFDIGFNRIPRASFQRALVRNGRKAIVGEDSVGKPAKLDVLFCRDPIAEADHPENYQTPCQALNLEQLLKLMIIYELHGLNDIAVDTIERFADRLKGTLDTEQAIRLLADPHCRPGPLRRFIRNARRSVRRRVRSAIGGGE